MVHLLFNKELRIKITLEYTEKSHGLQTGKFETRSAHDEKEFDFLSFFVYDRHSFASPLFSGA